MSNLRAAKLKWYHKNRQQINQKRREQYRELMSQQSQLNSVDDVDNLNQSEFEDRDHMNEEDLYKTNDTDQCSLLFNHDNTFYDTLISETCTSDDEESFDENETDVIVEGDGNDNEKKNEMFNDQFQRDCDETDISVCLLTLKTKHNLTFECLSDIRKLLIVLKVQNVPSSIYHIRKLINTKGRSTPRTLSSTGTSSMIICQKCERVSFSKTSCSHTDCENHEKYTTNPYNYIYFDICDQLQQIFRREQHINFFTPENKPFINTSMHDIYDGKVYRSLFSQVETNQTNYIMTLMMNVDGVAIGNNTEQSLWIITCAINEIKRKQRFKIQNVVVGGICSCYKKPSRAIMQILLKPIVNQLLLLEEQHLFQIKGTKNEYKLIRMYLIGACNDKPANSLVQNAPEPIAKYGCSRCELCGETVLSNSNDEIAQNKSSSTDKKSRKHTHKIRVFPTNEDNQTQLRSTARCQLILNKLSKLKHNKQCLNDEKESNLRLGYSGKCSLTDLTYFDHGYSFLMDTLHTIYHGAFKRLMKLWFHQKYRTPQWSIRKHMNDIETDLQRFRFPSTTTRAPRSIMKYYRLKANESRVLLLITYPIFQNYLKPIYYKHLQLLSFALHVGESREITSPKLNEMKILLDKFVYTFHFLYGKRHTVNTVHSVIHFHQTVTDYGPLTNYSTFNFESVIGRIASTVNGTKNLPREIENNLELIKNSSFLLDMYCISSRLYLFISDLQDCKSNPSIVSNNYQVQKPTSVIHDNDKQELLLKFGKELLLYNKCFIKGGMFTTLHYSKSKQFQDCAILYRRENEHYFGIINKIILIQTSNNLLFQVLPLCNNKKRSSIVKFQHTKNIVR
ncbi:unnamed protein product [Didymodactylos carnosus]|uniref:Uncharacterized protein n=1 Tax=Didymodactylos carnosus TaxID=1234261 RepID=A0A815JDG8_9BILA|nr:unnamed protein product [Didymodactylos carnosus]CAF4270411.1 unnamed protein product [Didymodactylos carnosus]